jgi:MFS family permease
MVVSHGIFLLLSFFLLHTETVVIKLEEYRKTVFTPQVIFLTLVFVLSSLHWGAETVSYGPFLKDVLGLTFRQIGLYTGLGMVAVGLGAYGGTLLLNKGWVKDLQSLFGLGLLLAGVFHGLMCVPHVYWSFGFRFLHEIGDGFVLLIFYHGIAKVFHVDRIGGCAAFIALGQSVSAFGSSILFGYVGDVFGHQWSLIISGIVLVLAVALLYVNKRGIFQVDSPVCVCSASNS